MRTVVVLLGCPGAGKTRHLVEHEHSYLMFLGFEPREIALLSFTNAAADEALGRLLKAHPGSTERDFPWVRTEHSICFRLLGLDRDGVMTGKRYKELGEVLGYSFSPEAADSVFDVEDQPRFSERMLELLGDYLLSFDQWRRHMMKQDVEGAAYEYAELVVPPPGWSVERAVRFCHDYREYRRQKGLFDFTDMLEMVLWQRLSPGCRAYIMDEAQDSSPLIWAVFNMWSRNAEYVCVAGDPFQCIYSWAGADPSLLLGYPGERCDLAQSHRCARAIHRVANSILKHVVDWRPVNREGEVAVADFYSIPLETKGKTFLLARNRYLLERYVARCVEEGIPFKNLRGESPLDKGEAKAFRTLWRVVHGKSCLAAEVKVMLEHIRSKPWLIRGCKTHFAAIPGDTEISAGEVTRWFSPEMLQRLAAFKGNPARFPPHALPFSFGDNLKFYYLRLASKYGDVVFSDKFKPQTILGTIHSVKGAEADRVILMAEMASRSYQNIFRRPLEERMVFYVGVTRARDRLLVVEPWYWQHYRPLVEAARG